MLRGFDRLPFCDLGEVRLPAVAVVHIPQFSFADSHLRVRLQLLAERSIGGATMWGELPCIERENFLQIRALFCNLALDRLWVRSAKRRVRSWECQ
jgi:hypothetical protein